MTHLLRSDAKDKVWMNFSWPPLEVVMSTSVVGKFVNMSFRPWSLKTSPCHRDRFQLEPRYASIVLYWSLFDWNCPCMFRTPVWVGRTETCITFNINIIIQVASNWDIPDDVCIINLWLLSLAKFIYLLWKSLRHCCYNTACPLGNTDCQVYIYHMIKKEKKIINQRAWWWYRLEVSLRRWITRLIFCITITKKRTCLPCNSRGGKNAEWYSITPLF